MHFKKEWICCVLIEWKIEDMGWCSDLKYVERSKNFGRKLKIWIDWQKEKHEIYVPVFMEFVEA